MNEAIKQAEKARKMGEVPIGCVVVKDGKIIGKGHNLREKKQNALLHAEIVAISKACKKLKSWRLDGSELFVTLEPCPMCAGAIANARISKVFYSAKDKSENFELIENIFSSTRLNHKVEIIQGLYEKETSKMLTDFFSKKRKNK